MPELIGLDSRWAVFIDTTVPWHDFISFPERRAKAPSVVRFGPPNKDEMPGIFGLARFPWFICPTLHDWLEELEPGVHDYFPLDAICDKPIKGHTDQGRYYFLSPPHRRGRCRYRGDGILGRRLRRQLKSSCRRARCDQRACCHWPPPLAARKASRWPGHVLRRALETNQAGQDERPGTKEKSQTEE